MSASDTYPDLARRVDLEIAGGNPSRIARQADAALREIDDLRSEVIRLRLAEDVAHLMNQGLDDAQPQDPH